MRSHGIASHGSMGSRKSIRDHGARHVGRLLPCGVGGSFYSGAVEGAFTSQYDTSPAPAGAGAGALTTPGDDAGRVTGLGVVGAPKNFLAGGYFLVSHEGVG
eukprot:scaffold152738_cov33-Tisochrysis_lutea.AAC.1